MTTQTEEWRAIAQWPSYEISSMGRIRRVTAYRSTYPGRILKPYLSKGYYAIRIAVNGRYKSRTIHALVAETFIGPRPDGAVINHKDAVKTNNCADNLEYTTPAGNSQHAYMHGVIAPPQNWRSDPERAQQAQAKRKASMPPNANKGERNGAHTHPEQRRRGLLHGMAKYTTEQLQQARDLLAQNLTNREIARLTGVREDTVSNIKRGKHWICNQP